MLYTAYMINLSAAGLSGTDTKYYLALLEKSEWKPSELAKYVNETRTNCYKVLDKLVSLGLAEKFDKNKKFHYRAFNPTALLDASQAIKSKRLLEEEELEIQVKTLVQDYIKVNEKPGIRYFQGKAQLKEIYLDQVASGDPVYIIRPNYNMDLYDFDYMSEIRHMARRAGIQRYAITPDRPKAPVNYKESDPYMLLSRTWISQDDYQSPVEWVSYGNKLAIMSFGNEATGLIIESPQIAESFRELYKLLDTKIRIDPDYKKFPRKAKYIGATKDK